LRSATPQKRAKRHVYLALLALALAACDAVGPPGETSTPVPPSGTPAVPIEPVELTVFAAASLREAVEQAATAFELSQPDVTVVVSFDSSAALATQIEQGAPADVFLSADSQNPQRLIDAGLAAGDPIAFAANQLAIAVPLDNPAGIESPSDLAGDGVRIVAAGDEVPITRYAAQLISNLASEPGYPAAFAARYAANVVSKEDNVRAVLAKVELGEADAAIVYTTDAAASSDVETVAVPPHANVQATYAGIVLAGTDDAPTAQGYLEWLAGQHGQAIFAGLGFLPPPE
jgi:molybdate transport system substrate-binding protein